MGANVSGNYNCGKLELPTFLGTIIANISGIIFSGYQLLIFLENILANISENNISGFREVVTDNTIENFVTTVLKH